MNGFDMLEQLTSFLMCSILYCLWSVCHQVYGKYAALNYLLKPVDPWRSKKATISRIEEKEECSHAWTVWPVIAKHIVEQNHSPPHCTYFRRWLVFVATQDNTVRKGAIITHVVLAGGKILVSKVLKEIDEAALISTKCLQFISLLILTAKKFVRGDEAISLRGQCDASINISGTMPGVYGTLQDFNTLNLTW